MIASNDKNITLVGAGLVGSLLAVFLARRGFGVTIFERRPDMRVDSISAGRSINLAISVRGLHALSQVGLSDEILKIAIPMHGRMMHDVDGQLTKQPYGKDDSQFINSVSRGELNKMLMTEAEKTGLVDIHFHTKVAGIDFEKNQLTIEHDGGFKKLPFKHVIATDGSGSVVRDAIMTANQKFADIQHENYGYKELTVPPGPNQSFLMQKNFLHIWPRGRYMLIALPNIDGSFTCTLFLPLTGDLSFETLKSKNDVESFFKRDFSDAMSIIPNIAETFFENPTGSLTTVRCAPWHYKDKALLMGDAAHAIVPFFGQGANCGFEDVSVFNELLEQHDADFYSIFEKISSNRKPNADAIAHMALENFIEMRDKVGRPEFLLRKQVERLLEAKFPAQFTPRYSLVTFSRLPYAEAEAVGKQQDAVLDELCKNLNQASDVDFVKAETLLEKQLG